MPILPLPITQSIRSTRNHILPFQPFRQSTRGAKILYPPPVKPPQPYELPLGYSYYKNHNDIPMTPPPPHARIYKSEIPPPHLPRSNVFGYLFPPKVKGEPPRYYAETDPKAIGFIDGLTGREVLREELPVRAMWLASGIRKLGVTKNDVVCLFGMNSLEWVEACFGVQAADAIMTPANYAYTPPELLHQLTDSNAKMIFIQPSLIPTLEAALKSSPEYTIPSSHILLLCAYSDKPPNTPYRSMDEIYGPQRKPTRFPADGEKETAYLCYSSGTTGRAKGVMTSYHNMTSQLQAVNTVYEPLTPNDVVLGILPFSHIYGLTLLVHQPLTRGCPVVVLPKFDEIQVLEAIQKYRITWALVVPPVLLALANSKHVDNYDLSSLRGVQTGAAPCSQSLIDAFEARFPQIRVSRGYGKPSELQPACRVTQGYGMTETSPVTHVMTVDEGARHVGSIGKIMPTMQARLVDAESGFDVAEGERGELWLRGSSVMSGYWKNEEATRNAFAEGGWLKTGDVAMVDKEGYFYIVDRVKELIKYKGFQVPPAELEALLITHPLVSDAGVIGVYSEYQATELPRAYISLKKGLSSLNSPAKEVEVEKEIMLWVQKRVANHKRLRGGIVFVDTVPKSPSGKILRKDLRERAKAEMERRGGMVNAKL